LYGYTRAAMMSSATPDRPSGPAVSGSAALGRQPVEQEMVEHPARVIRIGSMSRQMLEELRQAPLDDASRTRLREIYELSISELSKGIPDDLRQELARVTSPFASDAVPSQAELRVAQAQLVGWLEGLFQGIQAALFAQQFTARAQLDHIRRNSSGAGGAAELDMSGTYL